ncbi:MAG: LuxR family transcriptional regulator [Variovorax sp.]|nr:LuxR family transcriptional regulator [Variovorax sp.]
MRQWAPASGPDGPAAWARAGEALGGMVRRLGERGFETGVLEALHPLVPAASWSVYRTGRQCRPTLFMSASHGIPDTTRNCWWAYLSGPYLHDRSWGHGADTVDAAPVTQLCHILGRELGGEHQARVYEAHGMEERVSIVQHEADQALFAVNFYRHRHQRPFTDAQIGIFGEMAPALLELARKHIALSARPLASAPALRERLLQMHAGFTARELDVCVRLLQGMTQEGIARDLDLGVPTVKTYRNRAFGRLGIHFRNELFALALEARVPH